MIKSTSFDSKILYLCTIITTMRLIVKFFEWLKKLPVPVVYLLFLFINLTWVYIICTILDHFDLGNVYNILIQGVLGLTLMIIYLRAFFVRRDKGLRTRFQFVPYVQAGLYHCLYNLILIPLDSIYKALQ